MYGADYLNLTPMTSEEVQPRPGETSGRHPRTPPRHGLMEVLSCKGQLPAAARARGRTSWTVSDVAQEIDISCQTGLPGKHGDHLHGRQDDLR